jgi:hypothetical protein
MVRGRVHPRQTARCCPSPRRVSPEGQTPGLFRLDTGQVRPRGRIRPPPWGRPFAYTSTGWPRRRKRHADSRPGRGVVPFPGTQGKQGMYPFVPAAAVLSITCWAIRPDGPIPWLIGASVRFGALAPGPSQPRRLYGAFCTVAVAGGPARGRSSFGPAGDRGSWRPVFFFSRPALWCLFCARPGRAWPCSAPGPAGERRAAAMLVCRDTAGMDEDSVRRPWPKPSAKTCATGSRARFLSGPGRSRGPAVGLYGPYEPWIHVGLPYPHFRDWDGFSRADDVTGLCPGQAQALSSRPPDDARTLRARHHRPRQDGMRPGLYFPMPDGPLAAALGVRCGHGGPRCFSVRRSEIAPWPGMDNGMCKF